MPSEGLPSSEHLESSTAVCLLQAIAGFASHPAAVTLVREGKGEEQEGQRRWQKKGKARRTMHFLIRGRTMSTALFRDTLHFLLKESLKGL
jgi:hypothetical protein